MREWWRAMYPGLMGKSEMIVRKRDLVSRLGDMTVQVLSTPRLIQLLETAAVEAIQHLIRDFADNHTGSEPTQTVITASAGVAAEFSATESIVLPVTMGGKVRAMGAVYCV